MCHRCAVAFLSFCLMSSVQPPSFVLIEPVPAAPARDDGGVSHKNCKIYFTYKVAPVKAPAYQHSFTGWMPFLPLSQQH